MTCTDGTVVEALEAELATINLKHFPMFSGLKKPYKIGLVH
jgi:hypothetical protein